MHENYFYAIYIGNFIFIDIEGVSENFYVCIYIVVLLYLHKININMGSYIFMCSIIK